MNLSELQSSAFEDYPAVSRDDVRWIAAHALGVPMLELYLHSERVLTKAEAASFKAMLAEREAGRPLQYIFKEAHFRELDLVVGEGVLIPRPETEMMVDLALEALDSPNASICDLGTGSGAVALSIALESPQSMVVGVDSSRDALAYAERNKQRSKIGNVEFIYGNLFSPFSASLAALEGELKKFDLITANLPYVSKQFFDELPREVRGFEPESALLGGEDGLDVIRVAAETAPAHLKPGGTVIFEHSPEQTAAMAAILAENGFERVETVRDLTDKERFTLGVTM
jgi:release factor glutamine methyltransferase